jgi:hypothetical protein
MSSLLEERPDFADESIRHVGSLFGGGKAIAQITAKKARHARFAGQLGEVGVERWLVSSLSGQAVPGKRQEGVVFVGVAQEKVRVPRTVRKKFGEGGSIPWIDYSTAMVNVYYFYCLDEDFGPFFLKFCYRYDLSILQAEFSLTQIWDRGVNGRCFFEEVIRENIDLGRPEQVQLIFERKLRKPTVADGRCRTRIITEGVIPSLHVYYKNTHLKQYHKEGRALRTETTINNTYDFGVGRRSACFRSALRGSPGAGALCSPGFILFAASRLHQ